MSALAGRIAGAPISWGVCEVPGWGYQMAPERVLDEMGAVGLAATEFGPEGYLPRDPKERLALLRKHRLAAVGGFLPLVLHDPEHDPLPAADRFIDDCLATGASLMVLAAHTGEEGYEERPEIDEWGWRTLLANLDRIDVRAHERGVLATLHPHLGTMVEGPGEVSRVLDGSRIGICLDTGHLLAGGTDPVQHAVDHSDRVAHVHLKDVDATLSAQVADGSLNYGDAVERGIYRPLGQGDVDVRTIVKALEDAGYTGWYVLEQDIRLHGEPEGEGPVRDVRDSLAHLDEVAP